MRRPSAVTGGRDTAAAPMLGGAASQCPKSAGASFTSGRGPVEEQAASERNDSLSKVPVLGDIPAVGNLFRNKDRRNSKVELLIFVTPKILTDSQ